MLSEQECPYTGPYALAKNSNGYPSKGPTCEALKRACSRMGAPSLPWGNFDQHYNQNLEDGLDYVDKTFFNTTNANGYATGRWERMRSAVVPAEFDHAGEPAFDAYSLNIIQKEAKDKNPKVPDLGPIFSGGKSVLDHDLTHNTDGLPLFPAFDDAFKQGLTIYAPEDLEVYKQSHSNPGIAFYAEGASKLRYWFGHLTSSPANGTKIKKGGKLSTVGPNTIGGGPHCHVGVNVELLWGTGKELAHHVNYTHGAPTIGTQLASDPQ